MILVEWLLVLNKLKLILTMQKSKVLWWLGMVVAILTAIIGYCSCTAGISVGRANTVQQTVTNHLDSTVTTFSLTPIK